MRPREVNAMPENNWEQVATPEGVYRYRIRSTGDSSRKYGNCEICDQHASEMFIQVEERQYFNLGKSEQGWTQYKCKTSFGHYDCLVNGRRKGDAPATIGDLSGGNNANEYQ